MSTRLKRACGFHFKMSGGSHENKLQEVADVAIVHDPAIICQQSTPLYAGTAYINNEKNSNEYSEEKRKPDDKSNNKLRKFILIDHLRDKICNRNQ